MVEQHGNPPIFTPLIFNALRHAYGSDAVNALGNVLIFRSDVSRTPLPVRSRKQRRERYRLAASGDPDYIPLNNIVFAIGKLVGENAWLAPVSGAEPSPVRRATRLHTLIEVGHVHDIIGRRLPEFADEQTLAWHPDFPLRPADFRRQLREQLHAGIPTPPRS